MIPYIQIARLDHWFKNVFMLFGFMLALFMVNEMPDGSVYVRLLIGVIITGIIASSNYVINEILDAPKDMFHPEKKNRPIPSGKVKLPIAYAEWLILGAIGIYSAFQINTGFGMSGAALWIMGCFYNIPPIRTKEIPYLDVISESVNNPLRLLLGWFILIPDKVPPMSLCISYWMLGAFFMAIKRFAEYRMIDDPENAAQYRASFEHYDADRLLVSTVFYGLVGACFAGVFIVRYHLELVLFLPVAAAFVAYYLKVGLKHNSPVQAPEKLYKEPGLVAVCLFSLVVFILLMLVDIPILYKLFNVEPSRLSPLWTFGN